MNLMARACELCHQEASVYCCSDSAFLCSDCDSRVHAANFLAARHLRIAIFSPAALHDTDDASSSSSTSASAKSHNAMSGNSDRRIDVIMDGKTRGVLVNWCTKLGFIISGSGRSSDSINQVIEMAIHAFKVWGFGRSVFPYRVGLAASLWFSLLRAEEDEKTKPPLLPAMLKRLEEISGVPAKLIMAAESKLGRMLKLRKRNHQQRRRNVQAQAVEEGWAES